MIEKLIEYRNQYKEFSRKWVIAQALLEGWATAKLPQTLEIEMTKSLTAIIDQLDERWDGNDYIAGVLLEAKNLAKQLV